MPSAADLIGVALGMLYLTLGLAATAAAAAFRSERRNRSLVWFGVFTALYGIRLIARSDAVHRVTPFMATSWSWVEVLVTYSILVPAALLAASALGAGWRKVRGQLWLVNAVAAACSIAWDAAAGRPGAAMALNRALVVGNIATALLTVLLDRGQLRWSRDGWLVLASTAVFATVATYETIRGGIFGTIDTEPLAMLVVVLSLAYVVVKRAFQSERRVAAVERELEMARRIQQSIVPRKAPAVAGVSVATHYESMTEVAGDFFDFVVSPSGQLGILLADVSGHGVPAAMVASMVKIALAVQEGDTKDPGAVLTRMNRALYGRFELAYVTAVFAYIDPAARTLTYASAGHPSPLLLRRNGRVEPLEERGIVLGVLPDATYASAVVPDVGAGDRLLLYTDGITEAAAPDDEFFGDRQFERLLASSRELQVDRFVASLVRAPRQWVGVRFNDDVTVVAVDWV